MKWISIHKSVDIKLFMQCSHIFQMTSSKKGLDNADPSVFFFVQKGGFYIWRLPIFSTLFKNFYTSLLILKHSYDSTAVMAQWFSSVPFKANVLCSNPQGMFVFYFFTYCVLKSVKRLFTSTKELYVHKWFSYVLHILKPC